MGDWWLLRQILGAAFVYETQYIEPNDNGDDDLSIIILVMMMSKAMTASCLQQVIIHSSRPGRIWQSGLFHTRAITFDQGTSWNVGFWTDLPIQYILLMVCVFWPVTKLNLNDWKVSWVPRQLGKYQHFLKTTRTASIAASIALKDEWLSEEGRCTAA